jgi:hypothetical protein
MLRPSGIASVVTFVLLPTVFATAQGNMTVARTQRASSLNGMVVDGEGTPIVDVTVAECSVDFKECVTVAHSDKDGHFKVHSTLAGKIHYLRFDLPGMDEERVTVTLARFSKKLRVRLTVGT